MHFVRTNWRIVATRQIAMTLLSLDPSIRDKVLLPLLLFVAVFSLTRGYLFRLLMPKPDSAEGDEARQK